MAGFLAPVNIDCGWMAVWVAAYRFAENKAVVVK